MKRLNKKGFTLIELLAVIVLLVILAVGGGTAIARMMNQSKRTNFVTAYNNVRTAVEDKVALGEDIPTSDNVASMFDLSAKDYYLTIVEETTYYKITLTIPKKDADVAATNASGDTPKNAGGTYATISLNADVCAKRKGLSYTPTGQSHNCTESGVPIIVGYVEK